MDGPAKTPPAAPHTKENYKKVLRDELSQQVQAGDIEALIQLGRLHQHGIGVPRSIEKAAQCFVNAYRNGTHIDAGEMQIQAAFDAALNLSELYGDNGEFDQSIEWLRKALATAPDVVKNPAEDIRFTVVGKARELADKFSQVEEGLFNTTAEDKPAIKYLLFADALICSLRDTYRENYDVSRFSIYPVFTDIQYRLGDLYLNCRITNQDKAKAAECFALAELYGRDQTNAKERHKMLGTQPYSVSQRPSLVASPLETNTPQTKNLSTNFYDDL